MDINRVLFLLKELREEWYKKPSSYRMKRVNFDLSSYQQAAFKEMEVYIISNMNIDPIEAIENFRYETDCYACSAKTPTANFMFSVYCEMAENVLDVLRAMLQEVGNIVSDSRSIWKCS